MSTLIITPDAQKELDKAIKQHEECIINLADAIAKKANKTVIMAADVEKAIKVYEGFDFIAHVESLLTKENPKLTQYFYDAFMRKVAP